MWRTYLFTAAVMLLLSVQAFATSGDEILGTWIDEDGKAKIEIFHCEDKYCGKIIWLRKPTYSADENEGIVGKPRMDLKNQDPALQNRLLLGLLIMEGFVYSGDNTYEKGQVYDPDSGKTYHGKVTLVSPNRLFLKGYVGIPLFGKSTTWTR